MKLRIMRKGATTGYYIDTLQFSEPVTVFRPCSARTSGYIECVEQTEWKDIPIVDENGEEI